MPVVAAARSRPSVRPQLAFSRICRTRQRLSLLSGRVSAINTRSPIAQRLCSSWALYLARRRTYFLYWGCWTRRWTTTTTVLSILLLTTTPSRVLARPRGMRSCPLRHAGLQPLGLDRLDAGDVAPRLGEGGRALQLIGAAAHA